MLISRKCFILSFAVILFLAEYTNSASLSLYEQKKYKHLIEGQGLYSPTDDVEILSAQNFKNLVFNQNHAHVIEFYNSWCGFCQRFAPSWKALATDMKLWRNMIKIGAIDCADDANNPLCREFEIMGYPTLRYFHEGYTHGIGSEVSKGSDMEEHKTHILKYMMVEQTSGRGIQYPNLQPYIHSGLKHLFDETHVNSRYAFIIIDAPNKLLGPQIELDFWKFKEIGVRYAVDNNTELIKNLNAKELPFMMVITDAEKAHSFPEGLNTRESLRNAIVEYVKPELKINFDFNVSTSDLYTGKWIDAQVPDLESLMEAKRKQMLRQKIKELGDKVYQVDLETALKFSLKHDVANALNITGPKLQALRNYVNVLRKYFPIGRNGQIFLGELNNLVSRNHVEGSDIANLVTRNEPENKLVFSSKQNWMSCEGSSPEKRGHPCGMWKLFHYLTVKASESKIEDQPNEILNAMYGYVKYFFGCTDCSRHFQDMALRKNIESVRAPENAILWLWEAHNEVNQRLSGDDTEDPEYPKVQFPSSENCPLCRSANSKWDQTEVLKYLHSMYGSANVNYLGSNLQNQQHQHQVKDDDNRTSTTRSAFEQLDAKRISEKDVRT